MPRRRKSNSSVGIITLGVIFACLMTCMVGIFISLFNNNPITAAPPPALVPADSIPTIIAQTALAAQAQTSAAASPTPQPSLTPTETLASTINIEPTSTIFVFEMQTDAAQPTLFVFETNTPFVLATQPPSQGNAVCSCSGDTLNCSDFSTHSSAQECFEYCISKGVGDIHKLDGNDKDGLACEGLP
jgi:hypothetical protein